MHEYKSIAEYVPDLALAEQRSEKAALVADDTARVVSIFEGSTTLLIFKRASPIVIVVGQAGKGEQHQSNIVGTFRRQETAVMLTAELFDQRNPQSCIVLELPDFVRINHVSDMTCQHGHNRWRSPASEFNISFSTH